MSLISFSYQNLLKPILFQLEPEMVHDGFTAMGNLLGKSQVSRDLTKRLFNFSDKRLSQKIGGVTFENPVGLSAGFDYDGKMSGILSSVGFGFESVGTVTRHAYEGNIKPRLGRLPKSKSLLVNKGFKSLGTQVVLDKYLVKPSDKFVLGFSVGATNSPDTCEPESQIRDILEGVDILRQHKKYKLVDFVELNISCPNVMGAGTLAEKKYLKKVLGELGARNLGKPLFVKFPIHIEDKEALELVEIMVKYEVAAVVIGNLYKKRDVKNLDAGELEMVKDLKGNFSGKPTWDLSNHLISLVYSQFKKDIKIVGVGGIFNAEDAYHKIGLGASLVQLITGMIYQGPQQIGDINRGLVKYLERDGYGNISEAVGRVG